MREERRREGGVDYAATCCHALCCPVLYTFFILHLLFEGCDFPQCFFLLHVADSRTSFTYT